MSLDIHRAEALAHLGGCGPLALYDHGWGDLVRAIRTDAASVRAQVFGTRAVRPLSIVGDVAVLSMTGPIFRRADLFDEIVLGAVSVDSLRASFRAALDNPDVESILFLGDTPGGETSGVDDFAQEVLAARGRKRMAAIADGALLSAGYWVACAVDPGSLFVTKTGAVGSIGTMISHVDQTERDKMDGLTFTLIRSDDDKAAAGSHEKLLPEQRATLQAEVDRQAAMFRATVAKARPGLDVDAIKALKGGVRFGNEAVRAGLADRVTTLEGAYAALRKKTQRSAGRPAAMEDTPMHDDIQPAPLPAAAAPAPLPAAPSPPPSNVVAIDAATIRGEERKRATRIRALGSAYKLDAKRVDAFIESDASVEAIIDVLQGELAAQGDATAVSPAQVIPAQQPTAAAVVIDPAAIFAKRREQVVKAQQARQRVA